MSIQNGNGKVLLRDIIERKKKVVATIVKTDDDGNEREVEIGVYFNPGAFTPLLSQELEKMKESESQEISDPVVDMLEKLIVGWDIELEPGTPWTVSREHLRMLPFDVLVPLVESISKALVPNQTPVAS